MNLMTWRTVCLLSVVMSQVSTQCLNDVDHMGLIPNPDLSPILGFEVNLFKRLLPPGQMNNFFISPYSIWNALVLGYFGSSHDTEFQFAQALGLTDKLSTLRLYRSLEMAYYLRSLNPESDIFQIANKAYFNASIDIIPCMNGLLHSEIQVLNFNRPHLAAAVVNGFVSEVTQGKIDQICKPEDLLHAQMVLVNAAYFKGTWKHQFEESETRRQKFNVFDGTIVPVDMMYQINTYKFGHDMELKAEIVEIPYKGETTALYIVLPFKNDAASFVQMVSALNAESFNRLINSTQYTTMHLTIPKFTIETQIGDELTDALRMMGIIDAFDPRHSDFQGFSKNGYFTIGRSMHKAFVEVNEVGTEAAAATAFISPKSRIRQSFTADHPFLFVIRDTVTMNNMFMGVFRSPDVIVDDHMVPPEQEFQHPSPVQTAVDPYRQFKNSLPPGF